MILTNNLLPDKCKWVSEHAVKIYQTDGTYPIGSEIVPDQGPQWNYNSPGGNLARDRLIIYLLAGLCRTALNPKNFKKNLEVIRDKQENLSQFLQHLAKALPQYTNLDPENPDSMQLLMTYLLPRATPKQKTNWNIWSMDR